MHGLETQQHHRHLTGFRHLQRSVKLERPGACCETCFWLVHCKSFSWAAIHNCLQFSLHLLLISCVFWEFVQRALWGLSTSSCGFCCSHGCSGMTPLHMAALGGYTECCRKLIEAGAKVGARDDKGRTPTHLAAFGG